MSCLPYFSALSCILLFFTLLLVEAFHGTPMNDILGTERGRTVINFPFFPADS